MTSRTELHDLEHGHYEKTKVITGNADRSLGHDYKVSNIIYIYIYAHIYSILFTC
jgi:kinesin family protein 11